MRPVLILFAALAVASPALVAPALAADAFVTGVWLREDGAAQVRFAPCGDASCGFIAWVQDPVHASDIGLKVFYDMKPAGDGEWKGSAFNPEDGKTYSGKILLEGASLKTSGCVFGGLICKSYNWTRLK